MMASTEKLRKVARWASLAACLGLVFGSRALAAGAEPLAKADIDFAACQSYVNEAAAPVDREVVLAVLGLGGRFKGSGWSAADAGARGEAAACHYLVAFKRPVALGSAWVGTGELRSLKEGAPYPGDPNNPEHWLAPKVYPNQSRPCLVTLPPGTRARAVLVTEKPSWRQTSLRLLRLSARRLHNVTPDAAAQAESEYTQFQQLGPPSVFAASNVTHGWSRWQNTGPNQQERIPRPPISDIDPSWFVLSWDEPQSIAGLYLRDNFQAFELYCFRGPDSLSPVAAVEKEWKRLDGYAERADEGRWIDFEKPVTTRGLRLRILKTSPAPIAQIEALQVLTDLGEAPVPDFRTREKPVPPCRIAYTMPDDGKFTLAIDGPDGRRVRNVVARVPRAKGENAEHWDLKDEQGHLVAPGTYTWKAIACPPLGLRHEMTPYPNIVDNAPETSPWLNGASGPGGWLADHTPPYGVCTAGDWVFFGAPCAESGVSFIATDLDGHKRWGIHSFAAWTGPKRMATDGKTVFIENQAWRGSGEEGMDRVWGVDIATHEVQPIVQASQTEQRRRGISGMAADGMGKLFLAINARADWLTNAVGLGDVDIESCLPRYKKKKQSGLDWVPDPRDDFVRLFRITGTPPGTNGGLVTLESTKGPSRRQHIVLAFKRPVAIGSVAFPAPALDDDVKMRLSVLKPDAAYPPDPDEETQWIPFEDQGTVAWSVVPAPKVAATRALRITFVKGADDELADIMAEDHKTEPKGLSLDAGSDEAAGKGAWLGRLDGMKLLRRRYRSLLGVAKIQVNSGTVAPDGSWDAARAEPLTEERPGIYALVWEEPQRVRGLAIEEIDGKRTEIDAYVGPAAGPIDIASEKNWQHLATYEQARRYFYFPDDNHNSLARYMDGYVDFGREVETRAVRLRVCEQWITRKTDRAGLYGVRADRGGLKLEPSRCRVYGVAPVQYLGGEAPADPLIAQRIEVIDLATKKVAKEVPIVKPGGLACGPGGALFALADGKVVKVDLEGGHHQELVADLVEPTCLAFDGGDWPPVARSLPAAGKLPSGSPRAAGNLYVYDAAPDRKVVRVYDPAGKFLRAIGTPGGYKVGPWDPTRLDGITSLAVDRQDHLWAVSWHYWPKRICQWTTDGKFLRDFLGNTAYGGGGVLDPWDKSRLIYGNLEFELDWQKGSTRLKNLTWPDGWEAGEVPIRLGGRTYVVTRPGPAGATSFVGIVYLYEKDHLKRVAAVGLANYFAALRTGEILRKLGSRPLEDFQFIWTDRNGDGEVQAAEVAFSPKQIRGLTPFNRDLGVQAGATRYQVKDFLPNGAPVYEEVQSPKLAEALKGHLTDIYRLNDGNFFRMGNLESVLTPEGEMLWSYRTEGAGGHALNSASPWHPGQVLCEFGWIGHEKTDVAQPPPAVGAQARAPVPQGLGEFVVLHTNVGAWNIWTSDGLLAGPIFRDIREPGRLAWSMREHERGLRLDDVTAGQEHFSGYFCRSVADGKYYVVAGHNHASVVEVLGLDKVQRLTGQVQVSPEDVRKAQEWEQRNAKWAARDRVRVLDCYRRAEDIRIDGRLDDADWRPVGGGIEPAQLFTDEYARIHGIPYNASFRMTFDDDFLYLGYETRQMGPLKNTGNQWDHLFKTGASVDLQIGVDPEADPDRKRPVEGDFRLLMTLMGDKPVAVIYRPVAPGAPEGEAWQVVSPVFRLSFDQVRRLTDARIATSGGEGGYVLEAAVPLKTLGLKIAADTRVKMDWGILVTDRDGSVVLSRRYWANQATAILADAPSEAALHPDLWGYLRFFDRTRKGVRMIEPKDLLKPGSGTEPFGSPRAADLELEAK